MPLAQIEPWYDLPILGPFSMAVTTLTTVSAQVLAPDPTRSGVIFHNPGSQTKRVLPAGVTASDLATALAALAGGSGGIAIYPQEEYQLLQVPGGRFNVNCAWVAVTDNNADGALTVLDFTPANPNAQIVSPTTRLNQQIQVTSPTATQTNLATGSQQILPADPQRMGVQFHNPGTVNLGVSPSNLGAVIGAGSIVLLPGQTKTIVGNQRVKINCGWNGVAATGSGNGLTALGLYG